MEKFEKTIGEIKVNTGIACQSVLDMKITSMEGMHGTLAITFETDEGTAPDAVRGLKDMPVTVSLGDGTRLFAGICTSAALETAGGYKKVHVGAATASIKDGQEACKKRPSRIRQRRSGESRKRSARRMGRTSPSTVTCP